MWTDLAAQLWPALPLFFFAGACFVVAGVIWWVAIRRHNALVDDLTIPVVVHRDYPLAVDHGPRHRQDEDTCVIGRVPPYLPALSDPPPDDDDFVHDEIIIGPKLRQVAGPTPAELDALAARIKAATLGPASVLPVILPAAECPLTTDEIRIPTDETVPLFAATVERADTRDLTMPLAKILEAQR